MVKFLAIASLLIGLADAARVVMEEGRNGRSLEETKNPNWKASTRSDEKIQLTFALKQQNSQNLEKMLLDVSTPSSKNYGKLLTLDQVNKLTAPRPENLETVKKFLLEYGVVDFEYSSGFIKTTVPVEIAEKMLDTKYSTYTHSTTK